MKRYELVKSNIASLQPGLIFKMSLGDVENAQAERNINYAIIANIEQNEDDMFDDYVITLFGRRRSSELSGYMTVQDMLPWRYFVRDKFSETGVPVAGFLATLMLNQTLDSKNLYIQLDSKDGDYKIKVMLSDLTNDWISYMQEDLERDVMEIIEQANLELNEKEKEMNIKEKFNNVKEAVADVIEEVKEKVTEAKPVDVENTEDLKAKVSDVKVVGNPDTWMLLSKASSVMQGWMKSTKVMNVPGGIVVQVSTQVKDNVAEAVTFVPGTKAYRDEDGEVKLKAW